MSLDPFTSQASVPTHAARHQQSPACPTPGLCSHARNISHVHLSCRSAPPVAAPCMSLCRVPTCRREPCRAPGPHPHRPCPDERDKQHTTNTAHTRCLTTFFSFLHRSHLSLHTGTGGHTAATRGPTTAGTIPTLAIKSCMSKASNQRGLNVQLPGWHFVLHHPCGRNNKLGWYLCMRAAPAS